MIGKSPLRLVIILVTVLYVGVVGLTLVQADNPNAPTGVTTIEVNLRAGPDRTYNTLTTLPAKTVLVIEGRTADIQWLLVHTADTSARGWVIRKLVQLSGKFRPTDLPIFTASTAGALSAPKGGVSNLPPVPAAAFNVDTGGPIIPDISDSIRTTIQAIYDRGKKMGNNPRAFIKVGDCMTYRWTFLNVFGQRAYNLGNYGGLQGIIDYFNVPVASGYSSSWSVTSAAAANGFNSAAVLDSTWANPAVCQSGEYPLKCEIRLTKPSYAIIMFGASDVLTMTAAQFNYYMRFMVDQTEIAGVVPILSTFPENPTVPAASHQFNQIVYQIGRDKSLPVMNFYGAVAALPNHGLEPDNIHLTLPPGEKSGYFTDANLHFGYTVRNLVVLQALNQVVNAIKP